MQTSSKKIEIMNYAQELIQARGYNGFSFADIADQVGIRKASIHHHFPSKAALCTVIIKRYRETFRIQLEQIHQEKMDAFMKIEAYAKLYELVLNEKKLCLCGMLAADIETLPHILKNEIKEFFAMNVVWLANILNTHYQTFASNRLQALAWQIISSLQGAVTLARMADDADIFTATASELCAQLKRLT